MSLPTLNGTARLMDDPQLRYGASGGAVVTVRLAFNSRKKDPQSGEWKDDASFFVDGKAFGPAAENIAESLARGLEVVVSGRLKTDSWEKDGEKRSRPELLLDSIGPSLRNATAKVSKTTGGSGSGQRDARQAVQQGASGSGGDPWASGAAAGGQGAWGSGGGQGGWSSDEAPPF
ncbi:single-stranded DNA-binding protein [Streptomyces misionensis]|uniref:single-stranded DNA-binding protein n=1 Tax=Streptomyces misionensis TaxID=67331 RepID=UPI00396B9D3D